MIENLSYNDVMTRINDLFIMVPNDEYEKANPGFVNFIGNDKANVSKLEVIINPNNHVHQVSYLFKVNTPSKEKAVALKLLEILIGNTIPEAGEWVFQELLKHLMGWRSKDSWKRGSDFNFDGNFDSGTISVEGHQVIKSVLVVIGQKGNGDDDDEE